MILLLHLLTTDTTTARRIRFSPLERLNGRLKTVGRRINNALAKAGLGVSLKHSCVSPIFLAVNLHTYCYWETFEMVLKSPNSQLRKIDIGDNALLAKTVFGVIASVGWAALVIPIVFGSGPGSVLHVLGKGMNISNIFPHLTSN